MPPTVKSIITDVVVSLGAGVAIYFLTSEIIKLMDQNGPSMMRSRDSRKKASATLETLKKRHQHLAKLKLNDYELTLLDSVVLPENIEVSFGDIGGLESIIDDLRESILYPLTHPEIFPENSLLIEAPKGVLLYGPPGCGKTMIAKALAKESGANFLSIRMSAIMDKWYGESNKYVDAVFSLASKLEPCIVFVDEIDSFLRKRESSDHEITLSVKSEFMMLWDGLLTQGRVLVLGATNRPNDIDEAFLRRMPKKFQISKPGLQQRVQILSKLLKGSAVDEKFDIHKLAEITDGYSGSDLKEVCRDAAMRVAREYMRVHLKGGTEKKIELRPLRLSDFYVNDFERNEKDMVSYGDGRAKRQENMAREMEKKESFGREGEKNDISETVD